MSARLTLIPCPMWFDAPSRLAAGQGAGNLHRAALAVADVARNRGTENQTVTRTIFPVGRCLRMQIEEERQAARADPPKRS